MPSLRQLKPLMGLEPALMQLSTQQARATICSSVAYHMTRQVQSAYVVALLHPDTGRIAYLSDNAEAIFEQRAEALLGRVFWQLLTPECAEQTRELFDVALVKSASPRMPHTLTLAANGLNLSTVCYANDHYDCLEITLPPFQQSGLEASHLQFFQLAEALNDYTGKSADFADAVCQAIAKITGCERIYYCAFDAEDHGYVSGEYLSGTLYSLRNQHFPATDIPSNIRALYVKNTFRQIIDAAATPSMLLSAEGDHDTPVDLSYSLARHPGATHLTYLQNMGIRASMSFSVVREGKLAALFGGHHTQPKRLSYWQLSFCQRLAELYRTRYDLLVAQEQNQAVHVRSTQIEERIAELTQSPSLFTSLTSEQMEAWAALMDADHFCYRFEGQSNGTSGLRLAERERLLDDISAICPADGLWHTHHISKILPHYAAREKTISGVLACRLNDTSQTGHGLCLWIRHEVPYEEIWAGDPTKAIVQDEQGRVGPRQSFEQWKRRIEGTSTPWENYLLEIAQQLQQRLNRALLTHYQQRAHAAAEQAYQQKSLFLANVSHELRTPLHSIQGFTELLQTKLEKLTIEKTQSYLTQIQTSGDRLLILINDLLDLTKLNANKMQFHFAAHALTPLLQSAITEITPLSQAKKQHIALHGDDLPTMVCDKDRILQVLLNLLSNAVKFSPPESQIEITVLHLAEEHCLRIMVRDHGSGVPANDLESIFSPFIQSSQHYKGGTGLGLAICRSIMSAHEGHIWAENIPEGGACFTIEFPDTLTADKDTTP